MFRRLVLFLLIMIKSISVLASSINILGVEKQIDTLECRMVGPGINYTKFVLPEYPLTAYMLTIDLKNSYNSVETFQAENELKKTEGMTKAYHRLSRDSHKAIAGVNGNFWIVSGQGQPNELLGIPHSGSIMNGEIITDPNNWNRGREDTEPGLDIGFAMLDTNKKALIDDINFEGKVTIPNVGDYLLSEINRVRNPNELVMFNGFLGNQPTRTDDNGVEVFIKPTTEKWGVNKNVECVVTRIIADKGGNFLEAGESVLSGNGTGRAFLEKLSVGDRVFVTMAIKTLGNNEFPAVREMITGNALVMKNGVLTNRNYNETYNSMLYPRTGIGVSQDGNNLFMIVIDKQGASQGASTETMCGILKACGAVDITSMDGGGSAQMMLDGAIVNKPADGRERAVANGWLLFHNAPQDDVIARIEFEDHNIQIPIFASYKPNILGYNQYGVLIDKNVSEFNLTCSDDIGYIRENQTLVASHSAGSGFITAEVNGVRVTKSLNIVKSNISIKLDSVLIDNREGYTIEVFSTAKDKDMIVEPHYLDWSIEDPSICSIQNGVLKAIKNGRSLIMGSLGDFCDTLIVNVEIPHTEILLADKFNPEDWTLTATSGLNAVMNTENRPNMWEHGAAVNYVYKVVRLPKIELTKKITFYGLPDSLKLIFNAGETSLNRVILSLKSNNATQSVSKEFTSIVKKTDTEISIGLKDWFDTTDISTYPLQFEYISFYIDPSSMSAGKSYTLGLKDIQLVYNDVVLSSVSIVKENNFIIYPNPSNGNYINILLEGSRGQQVNTEIYNILGQKISTMQHDTFHDGMLNVDVHNLPPGQYLIKVEDEKFSSSATFTINK